VRTPREFQTVGAAAQNALAANDSGAMVAAVEKSWS